nr:RNA 3'-terminal phosphate cyclase isoform X4 [Halichoerus grypus]XP_035925430.1 RNA 3'-terminal phosphate cyclase isoform X4 [Halichoerus grypus]
MIRDLCDGQLEGAEIGSTEIMFTPEKIKGGIHTADTKTAGSVCLLMQVSMPCVLFAASASELRLKGGTNAEMAPQIDYTTMVFKPIVEKFGFKFNCDIKMRGYYPKGGGEVIVRMSPVKQLNPINLTDRGSVTKIYGRAFVAGVLPFKVAKDMAAAAVRCIRKEIRDLYVNIQPVQEPKDQAFGNGNGIIIIAETSTGCLFAGSSLGKRGVNADKVGIEAAEMLLANLRHGGAVDEYLQDQLIIFMALACGVSRIKTGPVTLHTQTAIHFAEQLAKVTAEAEHKPLALPRLSGYFDILNVSSWGSWVAQSLSAFGSGHDPRVLGSSPASGSLLHGKPASPSPTPSACVPSLALSLFLSNK